MKSVQLRDVVTKLCGLWMRIQPQLNPWSPLGVSIVWVANSVATSVFQRIGVEVLNFDTLKSPMNFHGIFHVFSDLSLFFELRERILWKDLLCHQLAEWTRSGGKDRGSQWCLGYFCWLSWDLPDSPFVMTRIIGWTANCQGRHPMLLYEAKLLKHLEGGQGIAHVYYSGSEGLV